MALTINGWTLADLVRVKNLPKIKDPRVERTVFCGASGYSVRLPDGNFQEITGPNAHRRTLMYLKELDQ